MPITKESFRFIAELWEHNNKKWFDKNRERYIEHVREPIKQLAGELAVPVSMLLPDFTGKPKISKINADIRFHPKKKPYKEHIWVSYKETGYEYSELFVYIDRKGWGAGAGIGAPKKELLECWRQNLIQHISLWRKYVKAAGVGKKIGVFSESKFKKPLYPDIPEDVLDIVQAKSVWIVENENKKKTKPTEGDLFNSICRMFPVYLFMTSSPKDLPYNLKNMLKSIHPPDDIYKIWKAVS
ncbi:MAG: DUF2461 domain-containing protein [candidate division Zixibacteria bacterium]|nr:DUF2461 domain-containing protein [candidate division Zixibacteria bacterium]